MFLLVRTIELRNWNLLNGLKNFNIIHRPIYEAENRLKKMCGPINVERNITHGDKSMLYFLFFKKKNWFQVSNGEKMRENQRRANGGKGE